MATKTGTKGFATMDPKLQREIARKGGLAVSRNKEWMSKIGTKGGLKSGMSRSKS